MARSDRDCKELRAVLGLPPSDLPYLFSHERKRYALLGFVPGSSQSKCLVRRESDGAVAQASLPYVRRVITEGVEQARRRRVTRKRHTVGPLLYLLSVGEEGALRSREAMDALRRALRMRADEDRLPTFVHHGVEYRAFGYILDSGPKSWRRCVAVRTSDGEPFRFSASAIRRAVAGVQVDVHDEPKG